MNVIIEETNKTKRLDYRIDGIDMAPDFIGNHAYNRDHTEDGTLIMSQSDYDWWAQVINDHIVMRRLIDTYVELYSRDEVDEALYTSDAFDADVDLQPDRVRRCLAEWFDEEG